MFGRSKRIKFQLECDNRLIEDEMINLVTTMGFLNVKRGCRFIKDIDLYIPIISGYCNSIDWNNLINVIEYESNILYKYLPSKRGIIRIWLYLAK